MHHRIKIEPQYFEAVLSGDKTFEIRYNDRGYQKGDEVTLVKFENGIESRQEINAIITYVTSFNQKENWVVFGIKTKTNKG